MWPTLLDMTREESMHNLRCLELDAFAGLVTAFRAQGSLNPEKLKVLKATGTMLNIPSDRHKAEIRRAVNDEKLNTIAYHSTGLKCSMEDWTQEGRRLIPLLSRVAPQTVYSAIADEVADTASRANKLLPHPACTERKRSAPPLSTPAPTPSSPTSVTQPDSNKIVTNAPKCDDTKKRKMSANDSGSVNKLMGPPKVAARPQPLNRLRAKMKQKDNLQLMKIRQQHEIDRPNQQPTTNLQQYSNQSAKTQPTQPADNTFSIKTNQSLPMTVHLNNSSLAKLNVLQNISIQPPKDGSNITDNLSNTDSNSDPPSTSLAENKPSVVKTLLPNKMIKVCPPRKTVTTSTGQKLVVVSNPSTSILQRTLTIPFVKNLSVKNYEKFKIVPPMSSMQISPLLNHFKNSAKHKVVTVRTNGSGHNSAMLPFSQIQMLNTKGAIKVLPFGSKLLTKPRTSNPIYLLNSATRTSVNALTDVITSPKVNVSVKSQPQIACDSNASSCSLAKSDMLQSLSDFDSDVGIAMNSADESSSDGSDTVVDSRTNSIEENHVMGAANHFGEDDSDEDDDVDDGDGNTNDSCKEVEDIPVPAEEQSFYVLENEDETVEAEISIDQTPCVLEQLDTCPYSDQILDQNNDMQLQEERITLNQRSPVFDTFES